MQFQNFIVALFISSTDYKSCVPWAWDQGVSFKLKTPDSSLEKSKLNL